MKSKLFYVLPVMAALLVLSSPALAADDAATGGKGMIGLGVGLAMGLSVLGAGLGQGRTASSAMEGMARNPQAGGDIRTSMLIALAFPESLVLFSFAIAYLLYSTI
ncbi:MAG: ATP synthase F0 subunit C [Myxococcota bacterium]